MATIIISGRKGSGKSSLARKIAIEHMNKNYKFPRFELHDLGDETIVYDTMTNSPVVVDRPTEDSKKLWDAHNFRIYSFADPLKQLASDLFDLDLEAIYGSDSQKNNKTHLCWADFPEEVQKKYNKKRKGKQSNGFLTNREFLEAFGTLICRKIDGNCWARATINLVKSEGYELSIVADGRFPNEVSMGGESNFKTIRLTRNPYNADTEPEKALDDFPWGNYTFVLDNKDMEMEEAHEEAMKKISRWLN